MSINWAEIHARDQRLFQAYWQASTNEAARAARNTIVEQFAPLIKKMAWRFVVHDQQDICADLEQDLYVSALEIIPAIPRNYSTPGSYLVRILKLRWRGYVRAILDQRDYAPHLESIDQQLNADGFNLAEILAMPTQRQQDSLASPTIQDALQILPPLQRIAIQRRYQFENLPFLAPPPGARLSHRWEKDALMRSYRSLRTILADQKERQLNA